jgi:NADH-quinone oxidoreductase subunit J
VNTLATRDLYLAMAVVILGAVGTYLLLPHRHGSAKPVRVHAVGGGLVGLSIALFALFWRAPAGPSLSSLFFYLFSFAAVAGAVLTITSRNPVYSALWFASVVLSTSGLFLLADAQFLAAGTVIVYAGAIIVTFLFVIMLAQMEGRAPYDRAARAPFRATLTCFLLFWALLYSLFLVPAPGSMAQRTTATASDRILPRTQDLASLAIPAKRLQVAQVLARSSRLTEQLFDAQGAAKPHVAGLGETLYTDYLVTVELAGVLLFVALVGALAIATPKAPIRPKNPNSPVPAAAATNA